MFRLFPVLILATATSVTASAQSCPPGASTASSIPSGAAVKVIGLHPEDAYYDGSYATTVGVSGTTTDTLDNQGDCWFSGPMNGNDGSSFYFYKAALSVQGGIAAEAPTTACPSGALTGQPVVGQKYTVLGLHPDDAYTGGGTVSNGMEVTFGDGTTVRDGCWISGPAQSSAGELYFFKVAVGSASAGGGRVLSSCPSNAHRGAIPAGSTLTFLGIDPEDAYANGTGNFQPGQVMTADGAMNSNGSCWYGGSVSWPGGSAYFYKAAFSVGGSATTVPADADAATRINALPGGDALDRDAKVIMLDVYDTNRSGMIDNLNELNGIPCDTLLSLDRQYQRKWSVSVRAVLGFKSSLSWVGGAIGFDESLRSQADRQMARCGIQ